MVFYFTGTGNSLYVAKQIESTPISIPQAIHQECQEYSADSIGIVAPVYGHEVPQMVKDFMKKAVFHTDYFYMILTYGNRHGGAAELAQKLCAQYGIAVHYINVIVMADNWLPAFDMNEQRKINKHIKESLAVILADLADKKNLISEVTDSDRAAHRQFVDAMSHLPSDVWQHLLHISDACVGCGVCERVCPSSSIRIVNGKAMHTPGHCQTCLACVHACPPKAIGLTVPEKNPDARYRNEHISLQEIMQANNQTQGGFIMRGTSDKELFDKNNIFGLGKENAAFAQYFIGKSYLNMLTEKDAAIPMSNVTFEPGCRNNWHIHRAKTGGGQMLICIAGEGWYQEEGRKAVSLKPGMIINIPVGVKHWHGAKKDSWFSHIAVAVPGVECRTEWCESVTDNEYNEL